jgi:UDP-3-O-[3-hydroxymyristoyl] glucosamine N-acyltransferase
MLRGMEMAIGELADRINAKLLGDPDQVVTHCSGLKQAQSCALSFVANRRYAKMLRNTKAGAVVIGPEDVDRASHLNRLVAENPYYAFRQAVVALHGFRKQPNGGVSDLASVHASAMVGEDCCVQPMAVIDAGAKIGKRCVIHAHSYIGRNVTLGDDCIIYPNVCLYDDCVLGNRVTIHAGTVVGEDGFGYAMHNGAHHKIPHVGIVVIEDDVEIGANCAIDRGTMDETRIGRGTKTSNCVVIGHNSNVGPHNIIVALAGLAGSVQTGQHVAIGGQAGIVGHVSIGDRAQIAAKTGVVANLAGDEQYGGYVAVPMEQTKKIVWESIHLPDLADEHREMLKRMDAMEAEMQSLRDQLATAKAAK